MIEFDQATSADALSFAMMRIPAYVMRSDGVPVALAGLTEMNGEMWAYLFVRGRLSRTESMAMVRRLRAQLKHIGSDVFIQCDKHYPQAPKLLRVIGFRKTDRVFNGMEVWKWQ